MSAKNRITVLYFHIIIKKFVLTSVLICRTYVAYVSLKYLERIEVDMNKIYIIAQKRKVSLFKVNLEVAFHLC
jgi:hypothetical protein